MSAQSSVFTLLTAALRVGGNDANNKPTDVFCRMVGIYYVDTRFNEPGKLHFKVRTMIYKIIELFAIIAYLVALIYAVLSGINTDDNDGY